LTYSGSASVEIPLLFKKKNAQSATDSGADERVLIKENGFYRQLPEGCEAVPFRRKEPQ
jgi:hypothetical protein